METDTKIKFGHRRNGKSYIPTFSIGNQTFSLQDVESKEAVKWYHKMLIKAFQQLNAEIIQKVELKLKPEYMNDVFTWKQFKDAMS